MRTHGHREGSITPWGLLEGNRGGTVGVGSCREIAWGEMPDIGDGEEGSKAHYHVCTYCNNLACSSHVPQKCNLKKRKEKDNPI